MLKKELSGKEIILVIFFIILSFFYVYYFIIYPYKSQRIYFEFRKIYVKKNITCSDNSPKWMRKFIELNIEKNKILANQLVYISKQGEIAHCESPSGFWGENKITKNTFFRYASNTKPITSAYILKLINDDKIKLTTTLSDIFPELIEGQVVDKRILNINIKNLLQHSSGFDRMLSKDIMFEDDIKPWCPYNVEKLKVEKLDFKPGEYSAYDNRNSCLLGLIIEKLENKKYREVVGRQFQFRDRKINFINGPYLKNEAKYDFTFNEFRFEDYYKHLDFYALSSSAGLVGSAESLALLLYKLSSDQKYLNFINFDKKNMLCDKNGSDCLNYTMYVKENSRRSVQYKYGNLPSSSSFSLIDKSGDIVVWMGGGERLDYYFKFEDYFLNSI